MADTSDLQQTLLPTKTEVHAREVEVAQASVSTESNPWAKLVNGLSTGASNLANLLPTGTFLAFTAIAPVVTDNGTCDEALEMNISIATVAFFALFCVFSNFTDSYQAADKKVYYGLVTLYGLWTPQLPDALHPGDKQQYKLTVLDVVHGLLSLVVFAACALMTPNVKKCFYPDIPSNYASIIPAVVGFCVSAVFVTFPSSRHGVGFPVSPSTLFGTVTTKDFDIENLQRSDSSTPASGSSDTATKK